MSEAPPARPVKTDTVPNREMVVYALAALGGDSRRIHTEDLAVKCHELFPESFSWTKYPRFPDKDIVRVALTDARKERHGGLVEGRTGQKHGHSAKTKRGPTPDGWMLTRGGVDWVKARGADLEALAGGPELKIHRQRILKQLAKVRKHQLFLDYLEEPSGFTPSIGALADLVRCRVDADRRVWDGRFDALERKAVSADQQDVVDFVERCREAYESQR